ncbi:two component, sigma54 specific, transcriptional regulator, Fis family [Anaeromyxobacter sp. K]|uniref:sigma-54-dependent transcriptional regulator n=1 Tax=Anaeromyxobacter sp. (strain K) TaxID=447217 RepID=UPI00017BE416|nr:sigma-54 dependent transcriptional regulator [Anaeromyxobacter sp. K]ACG74471.1 two component, sigma54 specific, transcriptional regulator, Fis family [Anaeromyxobacter sp. K]
MKLLLAEDDRIVRVTVRDALEEAGYQVTACADGAQALAAIEREPFDLVLTDVRLPGVDGLTLFRRTRRAQPDAGVVLMTAYADADDAVSVMREGARDYVQKPFEMDELLLRMQRVRDEHAFRKGMQAGAPPGPEAGGVLGDSAPMRRVRDRLDAAAASDVPVLVTGETGTGKDLCARTIHERSHRAGRPFVVVNCAAIPEALFESELFGHEKGAFTGADRKRIGRFEAADGGTLFLDEVGELAASSQAKLLRALESSTFEPVGSNRSVRVDVRVIAATNRDLASAIARGAFRKDLYYRLNVIDLHAPPLRERRGDVPVLTAAFLARIAGRLGRPVPQLEPAVVAALAAHDYPGNVRELQHALERAVALARGGPIRLEHLPPDLAGPLPAGEAAPAGEGLARLGEAVEQFEQQYIRRALEKTGGHRARAAALLGISRKSLWERLRDADRARDEGGEGGGEGGDRGG